ncbi:hypothetical protein Hanom_Chr05g00425791 [Helianthus anomalus]
MVLEVIVMVVGFFRILYGNHKVTKAQKKIRRKVGRKLLLPKNTTNTEVKSEETIAVNSRWRPI